MPEGINLGEIWASIGLDLQPLLREVQRAREVIRAADKELTQSAQQAGARASRAFASVQEAYAQMLANLALRPKLTPEEFEQFAARGREAIASMMAAERQHQAEVSRMAQEHRRTMSQLAQDHRQAMRSMAEETKKHADQARTSLSGMAAAIQHAFTAAFSLYAIRQTVRTLVDMATEAFRAEAGFRILERMLARTGQSADDAMSRLRVLSRELRVPVEVLARAASELTRYGFTIEQITDIFRGAAASGMLLGKSAADSIRIVNEALISQRSVMLNEIGIVENLDYAFQQYAKSLNKTADELTQTERAQAAWLMITRATAGEVADLPTLLQGYGGAVADLGQEMYRAQLAAGRALVPALTELARAAATVFSALQPLAGVLGTLAQAVVPLLAGVLVYRLIPAIQALRAAILAATAAVNPWHAAFAALVGVLSFFGLKAAAAARDIRPFYEESRARAQRLRGEADELDRLIRRFEELSGKPKLTAEEQRELQGVMEAIRKVQPALVSGYDDLKKAIENNIEPLRRYAEQLRNASNAELQMAAQRAQLELPARRDELARLERELQSRRASWNAVFENAMEMQQRATKLAEAFENGMAQFKKGAAYANETAFAEFDKLVAQYFSPAELMRKFGIANIAQFNEAMRQFLVEDARKVANAARQNAERAAGPVEQLQGKINELRASIQQMETAIAAWQRVQKGLSPFPEEKPAVAPPVPSKDASKEAQKVLRDLIQLEADALEALGRQREAALLRERAQHEQALAELKKAFNDKLITQEQYNKAVELENQRHNAEIANINKQFDEDEARRLIEKVRFEQDLLDAQEGESQARRLAAYQATLQQLQQSTEAYRQFALEIQRLQNETNDQGVQDQVERIRFEKQGAVEISDAIQQVLDKERMSARLREELTREVARLRKQAADEAAALEREGARQQMELADQATRALVAAIDRRAEAERLYAVEHAQLLRDLVAQADRGLVQMNWALRQELLQRAEDLERVGRERADEMARQGVEATWRLAEEATRAWMAHVRAMGETGQWSTEQQIASLRGLIREYQLTGELRADVEREIAQLQEAAVQRELERIERQAALEEWGASQQAEAIQAVLGREVMSARLREELSHRVALLRKQAAEEAAETERRGAEEAMRLADEATRAWVAAMDRRAEAENLYAVEHAQLLRDVVTQADRGLVQMSIALREELLRRAEDLERAGREQAERMRQEGAEATRRLAEQAVNEWVAHVRRMGEAGEWNVDRQIESLRTLMREYELTGELRARVEEEIAQLQRRQEEQTERIRREAGEMAVRSALEQQRELAEAYRVSVAAQVQAIRSSNLPLAEQLKLLMALRTQVGEYGYLGTQAYEVVAQAIQDVITGEEDVFRLASERAERQVEQLRQIQEATAQAAREQVESLERANLPLFRQLDVLFALRTALGELGDAGRRAFDEVVGPAIARVYTQLQELRDAGQRLLESFRSQAGAMARFRAVEFGMPVGRARDLQTAERLYAEIAEARIRATDAALADEEARFEASLASQVEAYRRAGMEQAEIDAWLAAQREAFHAEQTRRRVEIERRAAAEVGQTWARLLLGPFADPLEQFVRRLGEFRVGEKFRAAVEGLRDAFSRLIPDAFQDGLGRVLSWLRDQASRVGEWFHRGLSWLGERAGGLLSRAGEWAGQAFGGLGQAAAGALGSAGGALGGVIGALGSAAGAAAGALGALAGPVLDLVAAFVEASPQFKQFMGAFGAIFRDVATVFGALVEPIIPVLKEFHNALRPILQQLYPILRMFGGILAQVVKVMTPFLLFIFQLLIPIFRALFPVIKTVGVIFATVAGMIGDAWNLIANALNSVLGWAGVNLPTIDTGAIYAARNAMLEMELPEEGTQEELPSGEEGSRGTQISEITGPTRDLLVELLRPLAELNILPGLFENLRNVAVEIRDLLAASLGSSLSGAADALTAAATSLNDAASQLIAAVETLTASLRSEGGAFVVELVQSMEIAEVAAITISRVTTIEVAQADVVNITGNTRASGWPWTLFGLRAQGAA